MSQNYRRELIAARENFFCAQNIQTDPLGAIHSFTKYIDQLIICLFSDFIGHESHKICIIATGGYGRNELCPYSDIDLLIIHEGDHKEEKVSSCIRALWDMGLPLGCAVRSIAECRSILGEDLATDTSLLETRFLAGDYSLFLKLNQQIVHPYFSRRSQWFLSEMEASIRDGLFTSHNSLYMVEPDIKNGVCGLRDCQRVIWAQKVSLRKYSDQLDSLLPFPQRQRFLFVNSYTSLLRIRSALHMVAGKQDILEFSFQNQVAEIMGLGKKSAALLMESYFSTISSIKINLLMYLENRKRKTNFIEKTRRSLSAITLENKVKLLDGILTFHGTPPKDGTTAALWIMDLFSLSLSYQATFSVGLKITLREVSENLIPNDLFSSDVALSFRKLLSTRVPVGMIIKDMHETGFLEKLIPEFINLRCKVEYDSYHEYTVDQHTIMAICALDYLNQEKEDGIENIILSAGNLFILRLTILLHDIGKFGSSDHASAGAQLAQSICERLQLLQHEKSMVIFLIKHHLELSKLAFQRIPEEHVLQEFVIKTGDRTHLDLLYILTVVDIKSVGKKTWTTWKGIQLYDVYSRLCNMLDGKVIGNTQDANVKIHSLFQQEDINEKYKDIISAKDISIIAEKHTDFEQLTVCGIDRPHFFADIVGCISSEGYNILSSRVMTKEHLAIDIFQLEADTVTIINMEQHVINIKNKWQKIARGEISAQKLLNERMHRYPSKEGRINPFLKTSVAIDNNISREYTVLEIRSPDRFALLYKIAKTLSEFEVNISSAKLSTLVSLINDVFYVTDKAGKKIEDLQLIEKIKVSLVEAASNGKV